MYYVFFFFKQKTAYEIHQWLEFRRVLFRSLFEITKYWFALKNYFFLLFFLELRSYAEGWKKQQEEINFFETNVVAKLKTNPEIHIVPFNMTLTE